jgi:hypothetical protein
MVTWSECAADFVSDGSLRDVYVIDGGIHGSSPSLDRLARHRTRRPLLPAGARGVGLRADCGGRQERLDLLCTFLRELAPAVGRDVIVTPENCPASPILRARPTGEVRYEVPKDAA